MGSKKDPNRRQRAFSVFRKYMGNDWGQKMTPVVANGGWGLKKTPHRRTRINVKKDSFLTNPFQNIQMYLSVFIGVQNCSKESINIREHS